MNILDNPFYILEADPQDNRRRLTALAEEKSLLLDPSMVSAARNILTNPQKRLSAEIRWFPGVTKEKVTNILSFSNDLKKGLGANESILTDLGNLSTLNVKLSTLSYPPFKNSFQEKHMILEIGRLFENLDVRVLKDDINRDRTLAEFPLISNDFDIENELHAYRGEIQQHLTMRLSTLPQEEYITLITSLAEKYAVESDQYYGNAVIGDILAEYELRMAPEIEDQNQQMINMASYIKKSVTDIRLNDAIKDLSELIVEWHKLVQPLQLAARGSGQQHFLSEQVAYTIRELVLYLHNNYSRTSEALDLAKVLKECFAELPDFSERISEDASTLTRLNQENELEEQDQSESLCRNRMDKQYCVTIRSDRVSVPSFCTCCLRPTTTTETIRASSWQDSRKGETAHTVSIQMPICPACLNHRKKVQSLTWLVVILSVAIAAVTTPLLFLVLDFSFDIFLVILLVVAAVTYMLLGVIVRLPPLGAEHAAVQQSVRLCNIGTTGDTMTFSFTNWRYAKLFMSANTVQKFYGSANAPASPLLEIKYRNRAKSCLYLKAVDRPVGICFLVLALTAVIFMLFGSSLTSYGNASSASPASTSKSSTDSSYNAPSTASKPSTNTVPSNEDTKQQRRNALRAKLDILNCEIDDMDQQLANLIDERDYYEAQYYKTNDDIYVDLYNDIVDQYNTLWEEYDQSIVDYNEMVDEYNSLLN